MNFAEFLNRDSLERLWILTSHTCVGLRYGLLNYSFSCYFSTARSITLPLSVDQVIFSYQYLMSKDLPQTFPTALNAHSIARDNFPTVSQHQSNTI